MNHTAFYGRIYIGDLELMTQILETWVAARLRTKIRISGDEIEYEDDRLSFYCQTAASTMQKIARSGLSSQSNAKLVQPQSCTTC